MFNFRIYNNDMIQVIQPDNDIFLDDKNFKKDKIFIFLAGPIQGANNSR